VEGLFTPVIHFSTGLRSIIQKIAVPTVPRSAIGADLLSNILSPDPAGEKRERNDHILMPNNVQTLRFVAFFLDLPIFLLIFSRLCPILVSQTVAEFKRALNPLKLSGYYMYHQLQYTKIVHSFGKLYLHVPYDSHNKQR
jgi:hypothetical protein